MTRRITVFWGLCSLILLIAFGSSPVRAEISAFQQALAEEVASDRDLAEFYRSRSFQPLWTGQTDADRARRIALISALEDVAAHGLPAQRYDVASLRARLAATRSAKDRAAAEIALSMTFASLARDLGSGILRPAQVVPDVKRPVNTVDVVALLTRISATDPHNVVKSLAPNTPEYHRLLKAKLRMEQVIASGGWGPPVPTQSLELGDQGPSVVLLRDRLVRLGYLNQSARPHFDIGLEKAVRDFQSDHGLDVTGRAGASTLAALNTPAEARMQSILVALERERWFNLPRGARHILVNLTDFSARILDADRETFQTRAVVGKNTSDRRTPEFSDVMEFMVINPSWNVPRSIATKEYLPKLRANANALGHLQVINSKGRVVSRRAANFSAYSARSFPYRLKQPPGKRNALGLVKFMFPNKYNIYLHDTPAKDLFAREVRAYSHGCVRLHQPFEFAYALLAVQEADPKGYFASILNSGRETRVELETPVPVHIIYRTAFTDAKGRMQYRNDVYGRDAAIWQALSKAGVSLAPAQG